MACGAWWPRDPLERRRAEGVLRRDTDAEVEFGVFCCRGNPGGAVVQVDCEWVFRLGDVHASDAFELFHV